MSDTYDRTAVFKDMIEEIRAMFPVDTPQDHVAMLFTELRAAGVFTFENVRGERLQMCRQSLRLAFERFVIDGKNYYE